MSNVITSAIKEQMATTGMQQQSASDLQEELYKMRPSNMQGSLPRSPLLRNKRTGQLFPWCEQFAARPDLLECCDENGKPITIPDFTEEKVVKYNTDLSSKGVGSKASSVTLDAEHSVDYSVQPGNKDALVLPQQEESVAVSDLVGAILKDNL